MRKFLALIALIASPALAEEDYLAKARADLEATRAANRANEQQVIANNEALIKRYEAENAKIEAEHGPMRRRPTGLLRTYVYRGHYIGSNVVCYRGHCY